MTDDRLREAVNLAKEGNKFEARNLLDSLLRDDPENADAWLVMAQVVESRRLALMLSGPIAWTEGLGLPKRADNYRG